MKNVWTGKISILVPVYNLSEYLDACVNSVLTQRDSNLEIILVDDGSTDGSEGLCNAYAKDYPGQIRVCHQNHGGLIMARRQGIALAEGEVCMFLDADDMLAEGSLATLRSIFGETDADIVIFNYDNLYELTGATETDEILFKDGTVFEGKGKREIYEETIRTWRLNNLCMKAIRTELVRQDDTPYEQYKDIQFGEDLLQSLFPLTYAQRIAYCAKPLYVYRHRRSSMIGSAGRASHDRNAVETQLRRYFRIWEMDTPAMREVYAIRCIHKMIADFWQAYRASNTDSERCEVIHQDWWQCLSPETVSYRKSKSMNWKKRAQLEAIMVHSYPLIWLFERFGGHRIRRQYGE